MMAHAKSLVHFIHVFDCSASKWWLDTISYAWFVGCIYIHTCVWVIWILVGLLRWKQILFIPRRHSQMWLFLFWKCYCLGLINFKSALMYKLCELGFCWWLNMLYGLFSLVLIDIVWSYLELIYCWNYNLSTSSSH